MMFNTADLKRGGTYSKGTVSTKERLQERSSVSKIRVYCGRRQ